MSYKPAILGIRFSGAGLCSNEEANAQELRQYEFELTKQTPLGEIKLPNRPAREAYYVDVRVSDPRKIEIAFTTVAGEVAFKKEITDPEFFKRAENYLALVRIARNTLRQGSPSQIEAAEQNRTKAHDATKGRFLQLLGFETPHLPARQLCAVCVFASQKIG